MASRYWVGGTANWDGTAGTKWALTSGGAGGQAVPTSSDNVFFDANSGVGTCTIATVTANCLNLDCTGFTGTLSDDNVADINIYGSLKLVTGMTYLPPNNVNFVGTGSQTIDGAGKSFGSLNVNGSGLTLTAQSDLTGTSNLNIAQGTFTVGAHNIHFRTYQFLGTSTRTLNMGSGTWTIDATIAFQNWDAGGSNGTLNCQTSTMLVNGTGTNARTFNGGGYTYNIVTFSADNYTITGSNTFATLNVNTAGLATGLIFTNGTTQTVTTFATNGSAGNLAKMLSNSAGLAFTLSKSSGLVSVDYMSIKDSTATGGASWYAGANSTNVSGNTGWNFFAPPTIYGAFLYNML